MPSFFLLTCCWRPTGEGEAGRGRSRRRSWPPRGPPPLPWASPEEGGWSCSRAGRTRCWAVALKALMLAHLARPRPHAMAARHGGRARAAQWRGGGCGSHRPPRRAQIQLEAGGRGRHVRAHRRRCRRRCCNAPARPRTRLPPPHRVRPRSRRGFSGPGRRRCYPDGGLWLLHRARASPPRAGRYAAHGPRRRALARPAPHCRAGAAPAVPRAGAASAARGREAGELDALPCRSVRAATGGRPRAASHGRREQGPWPPDPARSSSAPWPRAAATSSSWRRKAGVGGVRPPPPPQSRRGRPHSAVAAPPARVGLRARAAQATGRGSRGGGGVAPRLASPPAPRGGPLPAERAPRRQRRMRRREK